MVAAVALRVIGAALSLAIARRIKGIPASDCLHWIRQSQVSTTSKAA